MAHVVLAVLRTAPVVRVLPNGRATRMTGLFVLKPSEGVAFALYGMAIETIQGPSRPCLRNGGPGALYRRFRGRSFSWVPSFDPKKCSLVGQGLQKSNGIMAVGEAEILPLDDKAKGPSLIFQFQGLQLPQSSIDVTAMPAIRAG